MKHPIAHSAGHWLGGIVAAATGVVLVRVIAPGCADVPRACLTVIGQVLALVGIVTIAFGVRRRVMQARADDAIPSSSAAQD